jgi:hypothetical protein
VDIRNKEENMFNSTREYDDIINLPHHISKKHPQMSIESRAAQFAPFAALTGYGDAICETARLTDKQIELDEEKKIAINETLQIIQINIATKPEVKITYFVPDSKKDGGEYRVTTNNVKKIDAYEKSLIMLDNLKIPINNIVEIEYIR